MIKTLVTNATKFIGKNSPLFLTGLAVAGVIGTTVIAVKATPKAVDAIEEEKYNQRKEKLKPVEVVKIAWKPYIPVVIMGGATIACIIGANTVNTKRNAALASAYILSEKALKDYSGKVIETFGEKKAQKIEDEIASDKVAKKPKNEDAIFDTGNGDTLCFDCTSGRYFRSDMEKLRRVENDANRMLLESNWISLNDIYFLMNLPVVSIGDDIGFDLQQDGYVDFHFSSCISEDGEPCLTVNFRVSPKYQYYYGG